MKSKLNRDKTAKSQKISIVSNNISPQLFYDKYVSNRQPVLIDGHLIDKEWLASNKWTLNYLKDRTGDQLVQVERRTGVSFGKGSQESMSMNELIHSILKGEDTLYLTTQELTYNVDEKPDLISQPIISLDSDFSSQPKITGNLIPQNVNLWLGSSVSETSSGLHHDYHDNLYILIKGKKRIRLFPPTAASSMYTYGELDKVYNNGRIVYKSQDKVRPDGASFQSEKAVKASLLVDQVAARIAEVSISHFAFFYFLLLFLTLTY